MFTGTHSQMAGQRSVFDSVFPSSRLRDLAPTPAATPVLSQTGFGQSFQSPTLPTDILAAGGSDSHPEQVTWDRSWHTATSFLSLPPKNFVVQRTQDDLNAFATHFNNATRSVVLAIRYLTSHQHIEDAAGGEEERENLIDWYTSHIRCHFLANAQASILQNLEGKDAGNSLLQLRDALDLIQSIYTYPLTKCILPHLEQFDAKVAANRFRRDFHAFAAYALPCASIERLLHTLLTECSKTILGIGDEAFKIGCRRAEVNQVPDTEMFYEPPELYFSAHYLSSDRVADLGDPSHGLVESEEVKATRSQLLSLMKSWSAVGLGGYNARKVFAAVLDELLTVFVEWSYGNVDEEESGVLSHLGYWIHNVFARYVVQVLNALKQGEGDDTIGYSEVNLSDMQGWREMAMTRLGALRTDELFDIMMNWDSDSHSRIDDLKHFITNPSTRNYVTSQFIRVLTSRLLQSGVSTLYILRIYISIIQAFRMLDPRGVLLDRVARPVRRYLRDRDDTVRVIVTGLFSGPPDENEKLPVDPEILTELANELKEHGIDMARDDDGDIDWNDMHWVPDPTDAAPDYRKSKNNDVIGSLMSLFESRDAIVKELQVMLSDRLLMSKANFEQEYTVLELLKIRFGETVLQSCSVMLRDVKQDSAKLDLLIRRDQGLESSGKEKGQEDGGSQPDFLVKTLSHLFWPTLQDQTFRVPTQILTQQHLYGKGYSDVKQSRKLTWLNALGQVEIELEFQDRVFQGEVTPWEASVIHAFEGDDLPEPVTRTVDEVATELEMAPLLVRSACKLWLSKSILAETAPDTFQVLETLPDGTEPGNPLQPVSINVAARGQAIVSSSSAAAAQAASLAASSASESVLQQKMAVYHQFIVSLLTNQGAMPLPRIVMMLGMVVPGGFPFSNEELKEFLGRMIRDGEVEMSGGGVYKAIVQT